MMRIKVFIAALMAVTVVSVGCAKKAANVEPQANTAVQGLTAIESITDAKAALTEGKRLLDENQTELSIHAFEHAIKLDPEFAEAYFNLGIANALLELQKEQTGEAIEMGSNSKSGKPRTRSEVAFEKAAETYKKWIAANPKDDVAQYDLGRTYSKLMLDEEAEESFEKAVKLKPEDTEYQTELGAVRIKLAKYREAIEPLKKAIELDAGNNRAVELLEDAEAGRQRIDYVSPKKDANSSNSNKSSSNTANSNSESNSAPPSNTKTNSAPKQTPPSGDGRPRTVEKKDKKGGTSPN